MRKINKIKNIYSSACVNCGRLIEDKKAIIIDGKNYCENCGVLKDKMLSSEFYAPVGILRILSYIFSFINPFFGFLLGAIFYSQKNNISAKKFGKNCLILMTVSLSFIFLFFIISLMLGISISGGDIFYNIKEGYY
ncbi:MAG: hypothetical protein N3E50_01275 [Candidatus Goldbacteria bacterium]|nr:hypothetical protein [Candidatus Goldiibacteriota bacterium]